MPEMASLQPFAGCITMLIGYVHVSTNDQNRMLQRNALESAGCELIFEDRMSGKTADRPGRNGKGARTRAGLAAARAEGRIGGRRPKFSSEEWAQMGRLIKNGMARKQVSIIYDVGVSTLYKKFPVSKCEVRN